MVAVDSMVHFSIPVSDVAASTRFYTDVVGLKHLQTVAHGTMAFLDAAGVCVILVKRDPPINPRAEGHGGVHHSFGIARAMYPANPVLSILPVRMERVPSSFVCQALIPPVGSTLP